MARKTTGVRSNKEVMFLGDNKELKYYLTAKRRTFEGILKERKKELSAQQKSSLKNKIDMIDDMLDQRYFTGRRHYTMQEMIDAIKDERAELDSVITPLEEEKDAAKMRADEAFKEEKNYLANSYEDMYDSEGQRRLRELIDEYDACSEELESYKRQWRALWWLLGVIHRPVGFFEKVMDE